MITHRKAMMQNQWKNTGSRNTLSDRPCRAKAYTSRVISAQTSLGSHAQ